MKTYGKVIGIIVSLAALAVSGTALAKHKDGHDTGQGPGPRTSIDVVNLCEPVPQDADDMPGVFLRVTSTITNETGDGVETPVEIDVSQVQIRGLQFVRNPNPPKKKTWVTAGSVHSIPDAGLSILPDESADYVAYINLCASDAIREDATSLNAEIQIMIDDRSFAGQCDDPLLEGDDPDPTDGIEEDTIDQSRIDLDDPQYAWVNCD
jgi:hypothetical protein